MNKFEELSQNIRISFKGLLSMTKLAVDMDKPMDMELNHDRI